MRKHEGKMQISFSHRKQKATSCLNFTLLIMVRDWLYIATLLKKTFAFDQVMMVTDDDDRSQWKRSEDPASHMQRDRVWFDWFFCFRKRKNTKSFRKDFSRAHKFYFYCCTWEGITFQHVTSWGRPQTLWTLSKWRLSGQFIRTRAYREHW